MRCHRDAMTTFTHANDALWPELAVNHARSFLHDRPTSESTVADMRTMVRDTDVLLVRDTANSAAPDGRLVGTALFFRMALTVPGGHIADAPGLTDVTVATTHRRRGLLRAMLDDLFTRWETARFPFAMLNASEAGIYERFGFGPATFAQRVEVTTRRARLRDYGPDEPVTWFATPDEAREHLPGIEKQWAATRPGALARSDAYWELFFAGSELIWPSGGVPVHHLLHSDGYASFWFQRGDKGQCLFVHEIRALTRGAHTELWRTLLATDLLSSVKALLPIDDPLPAKLVDLRAGECAGVTDMLWLRILDVPQALTVRTYRGDVNVVIEVLNDFRGRGGTFALSVVDGVATVSASSSTPTVRLDISVLGSIYLGGMRARALADAGRLWTDTPETLDAVDATFATAAAPFSGMSF